MNLNKKYIFISLSGCILIVKHNVLFLITTNLLVR